MFLSQLRIFAKMKCCSSLYCFLILQILILNISCFGQSVLSEDVETYTEFSCSSTTVVSNVTENTFNSSVPVLPTTKVARGTSSSTTVNMDSITKSQTNSQETSTEIITTIKSCSNSDPPENDNYELQEESVKITWEVCTPNGNISYFYVNITDDENTLSSTNKVNYTKEFANYSYELKNITSSKTYVVRIQANDDDDQTFGKVAQINFTTENIRSNSPAFINETKIGADYFEVTWLKPKSIGIIVDYEIELTDFVNNRSSNFQNHTCTNECAFKISKLLSNTNYGVKIRANTESLPGNWSPQINITTKALGPIDDIKPINVTSTSFSVTWTPVDGEIIKYNISLNKMKPNYTYSENCTFEEETIFYSTNEIIYDFNELEPFYNYNISISAISSEEEGEFSEPVSVTTLESQPEKPENLQNSIEDCSNDNQYNVSEIIKWSPPCKKNGLISQFNIYLEGTYTEDESVNFSDTFAIDYEETTSDYSYIISNLNSSFEYTVFIEAVLSDDNKSDRANISFTSPEWYPEQPESVQIKEQSATHTYVTWKQPTITNGKILFYALNFTNYGSILTNFQEYCEYDDEIYSEIKETDLLYYNFTNLNPYSNYGVSIQANTSIGYGQYSEEIFSSTKSAAPEQPQNFTSINIRVDQQKGAVDLNWSAPCQQNGNIKEFKITLNGIYSENNSEIYLNTTNVNFSKNQFLYTFSTSDLIPSTTYKAEIHAVLEDGTEGNSSENSFSLHSGIPEPPSIVKLITSKDTLTIVWENSPTPVGKITNYKIDIDPIAPLYQYEQDKSCIIKENTTTATINATTQTFTKTDLLPYYSYNVSIAATTDYNYGFPVTKSIQTEPFESEQPRNLSIIVDGPNSYNYDATATLTWLAPCKQNGLIKQYKIILQEINGKNQSFSEPHNFTLYFEYKIIFTSENLNPSTKYNVHIRAEMNDTTEGRIASKRFVTPEELINNLPLILGCIFGFIILIIFFIIFVLWRKKKLNFSFKKNKDIVVPYRKNYAEENIILKKFNAYYNKLNEDPKIINNQFKLLVEESKKFGYSTKFALLPENRRKNRYVNILPYDSTRVKLKMVEDDEISSDYINASFIKGYSGNVEYIATQGPLEITFEDFWKMVWQENVTVIVMVAQFIENNKDKCYKYIPNHQERMELSDSTEIRCSSELHFGTYCIRMLQVAKNSELRTVIHMQFLDWPDFGVPPNTTTLLQFCQDVRTRAKTEGGIIAVHCSAGVGRTGTLIATDILLQTIKMETSINIYNTVLELRKQRTNMVQTEAQFKFIHSCIKDVLENPIRTGSTEDLEPIYGNIGATRSPTTAKLLVGESAF